MISVRTNAKINITLDIIGKRDDGYHLIRSIMQTVTLCDTLSLRKTVKEGIFIRCNKPYIPTDERNIVYKVASAFFEKYGITPNVSVYIKKVIPSGAGLGGGSSNGAGMLDALCKLYNVDMTLEEKIELTRAIGADIPFFFKGGTVLCEGIGEILTEAPPLAECWIVISKPPKSVSTPAAYKSPLTLKNHGGTSTAFVLEALEKGNIQGVCDNAKNALETASMELCPDIENIKTELSQLGASLSMMSGSGSAVFGIFPSHKSAYNAYNTLAKKYKETYITKPI